MNHKISARHLLQTLSLFSVPLYTLSSLLSIGISKHGGKNRILAEWTVVCKCARNLQTAFCPAVEIRDYHMKDIGIGSEVLYRSGEKQRMEFEDYLTVNTKKQYR